MDKRISDLQSEIDNEVNLLKSRLLKNVSDKAKYIKRLEQNLQYIQWVNKKLKISMDSRKYTVAQREVYYCDLGINIGSEQGENRPVVILQNDFGNRSGNTTIVAPITSHENSVQYDNDKKKYYIDMIDMNGNPYRKYLDYYEVPIVIEDKSCGEIYGFVNIAHIREIDRKRICSRKTATITKDCFKDIKTAISKNLR